jgi:phosphoribosylformimino-5-aminoimidazole carboxamide ribonucleotide (ProFAR) isomerase
VEAVILFPAIDLKNGHCVRLEQGDMARATVFNLDPAAQARAISLPRKASNICTWSISTAPLPASR